MSVKLTQFSHGAGCGCKISPKMLSTILHGNIALPDNDKLLVGNSSRDDAAVYDLGNGMGLISTTDFFMPIVDDPLTFGKIAACNAISDVYAMGGKPIMAIAILGWPIDKISPEVAREVLDGARSICLEAGIVLGGGHSIDAPEPIFGLAVNGLVAVEELKKNNTATDGDLLFLTKPLGVGILTTAEKKGILKMEHQDLAAVSMMSLNRIGEKLSNIAGVTAMTDVTGFGLLGHLLEMAEGSGLSAEIDYNRIPLITPLLMNYINMGSVPGGTIRNKKSYQERMDVKEEHMWPILADPQTSGGLLVAVKPMFAKAVVELFEGNNLGVIEPIGRLTKAREKVIYVN